MDETLQDNAHRRIVRSGQTVRRPTFPWSPAVHALLRHLESVGFPYSPRLLDVVDDYEILTFIEGESGPDGWAKVVDSDGLVAHARLLRDYHDAVAGFAPPPGTAYVDGSARVGADDVVCHGDFGPWNVVWRGHTPAGLIDWDYAIVAPRLHDVAYALEYIAPFRSDEQAMRWLRYDAPPDRRSRIEIFAAAYGLTTVAGLVDAVIDVQRRGMTLVRDLARRGLEPQATWVRDGYLDDLVARVRWSEEHRDRLLP